MTHSEAINIMCNRCINHEACQGTGCEPRRILQHQANEIFDELMIEHRKEDYTSEMDSFVVSAMIGRVRRKIERRSKGLELEGE